MVVTKKENTSNNVFLFYTSIWHSLLLPRVASDADGEFNVFNAGPEQAMTRHAKGFDYMDDFSQWDIYRAQVPLLHLIFPDRTQDIVSSLVQKADDAGWMPIFPAWNSITQEMIGDHCCVLIADAAQKSLISPGDPITKRAFDHCMHSALTIPSEEEKMLGKGRKGIESYLSYGYVPLEDTMNEAPHPNQQASRTMEYSYNDFVLAKFALLMQTTSSNSNNNVSSLLKRGSWYRNVLDTGSGFVRGKYMNSSWYGSDDGNTFDSSVQYNWLTESNPWQYTFYAPQDIETLISLFGGTDAFVNKLDTFFDNGYYDHGNEPAHQTPFMYAYTSHTSDMKVIDDDESSSSAWKVQERVQNILNTQYSNTAGGESGNDDAGQLSAWFVMSSIGMYQVCPGCGAGLGSDNGGGGEYVLTTPSFARTVLYLPSSPSSSPSSSSSSNPVLFEILAPRSRDDADIYIQRATLNGKDYNCAFMTHDMLMKGGTLEYTLGPSPNKQWGSHGKRCLYRHVHK